MQGVKRQTKKIQLLRHRHPSAWGQEGWGLIKKLLLINPSSFLAPIGLRLGTLTL